MQRLKLLGLTLMALIVLSATATAVASAEELPNILPLGTEAKPVEFSAVSAGATLQIGTLKIVCKKDQFAAAATRGKLGRYKVSLEECEEQVLKVKCSSLNNTDAMAKIDIEGEFHMRYRVPRTAGVTFILLLVHLHVLCGALILFLILGCSGARVTPLNKLTKTSEAIFKETEGKEEITEVESENGKSTESCTMKAKKGSEEKEESTGLETTEDFEHFTQGGKAVEELIMA